MKPNDKNDRFWLVIAAIIVGGVSLPIAVYLHKHKAQNIVEMREAGCVITNYSGAMANVPVWQCPNYVDKITYNQWQGKK